MPGSPWPGSGPQVRYTVEFTLLPGEEKVRYRVVTVMGELKAAVMGAVRVRADHPDSQILRVDIVEREHKYTAHPDDVISYHEVA